jgi:TrpR-related protein YerC/YecD
MSKGMNKNTSVGTVKLIKGIGSKIDWNIKSNRQLVDAVLAIKNADEARRFLRDLMTEKEINEFANRLEAASLLSKDIQYDTISEDTGLSSATIARISKWLKGSLGGYRLILNRLSPSNNFGTGLRQHHHLSKTSVGKGLSLSS